MALLSCSSAASCYRLLSVLDSCIALFLVFPFTVTYFRGVWELVSHYVVPDSQPLQYWVHVGVGHVQVVGLVCLPWVEAHLDRSKRVWFWILSRLFMYVYTLCYMFYWHGVWMLSNHYLGTDGVDSAVTLAVIWAVLCVLGSCRSVIWPPFFIAVDTEPDSLRAVTRFKSKFQPGSYKEYVADAYLSQMVIIGMAICCWRSIFNVLDHFLFPDDAIHSEILSAYIGLAGCSAMLALQWPLGAVASKLSRAGKTSLKLVYEDMIYTLTFVVMGFLWRAGWYMSSRYFIPRIPFGSWVNFWLGSVGLLVMQTFTEVCNFGITLDGEEHGGDAFYPVHYLRIYFKGCYDPDKAKTTRPELLQKTKM